MAATPADDRTRVAKIAAAAAAKKLHDAYLSNKHEVDLLRKVRGVMYGAASRCRNKNGVGYMNYGGRGIEFRFPDAATAARWVIDNLGPPPDGTSIDRIDNNRHYEPGNLRWATRAEQANNKRKYKGAVYKYRMRMLQNSRPDYSYEGLRALVKLGWSDEQILNKRKGSHVSPSV